MENTRCQLWKVCPEEQYNFALAMIIVYLVYPTVPGYCQEAFFTKIGSQLKCIMISTGRTVLTLLSPLASLRDFDGSGSPSENTASTLPLAFAAGQHSCHFTTTSKDESEIPPTHPSPAV